MARWGKGQILSTIILLAVSIGSCSEKEGPPEDILSKEQFIHVLIEIHLIESKIDRLYVSSDSAKFLFNYFQGLLLKEEGIDSVRFQKTLTYYKDNPKPFMKVYEAVTDSLLELEAKGKLTTRKEEEEEKEKEILQEGDSSTVNKDSLGAVPIENRIKINKKGE